MLRLAAAAVLATGALAVVVPARAAAAATVPADTAVLLPGAPAVLAVPADGRLDGWGLTAQVLGVAIASKVDGMAAGPGQRLWVVGLRWQVDPSVPSAHLSLAVVADGRAIPLPLPAGGATVADSGPQYWAVPEPSAATDVTLQATSGGATQGFSLDQLHRTGPSAPALYRAVGQWRTVVPVGRTIDLALPPYLGFATAPLAVTLTSVTLGQYGPGGPTDTPPAGATAWLTVALASQQTDDGSTYFYSKATADQITLTLPGGQPVPATITPGGGADPEPQPNDGSTGLFPDRYAFPVPADLTAATLTVHLTDVSTGDVGAPLGTANLPAATYAIALPAPASPTPAAGAASIPRHYGTIGTAAVLPAHIPGAGHTSTTSNAPWIAAVVVLAAIGGGALLLTRRRQPAPAAPAPAWTTITPRPPAGPPPAAPTTSPIEQTAPPVTALPPTVDYHQHTPTAPVPTGPAPEPTKEAGGGLAAPYVAVMGPVVVEGWTAGAPTRTAVVDLVVYLACHPDRPVSTDRLRAALSGPAVDVSDATIHTYASRARTALGSAHVPPASERGYTLAGVDCDWTRFQQLTTQARAADDPDRASALLDQALGLARGRSFPDGSRWADLDGLPSAIDHGVVTAAARCAQLHLDAGRPERAERAATIGLEIAPTDEALAVALLRAGAATSHLPTAWTRITAGWADADLPLPANLTELRRRLAAGH